ncbi:MAG TPA: hypothetical protein VFP15_00500 [Gemmatimonadaceae bacterium]|nr:hypothetical protein [Gemmatimonadaceae bacterium]
MNWGMVGGLLLLVIWAVVALVMNGPGWIHLLLTVGVSLVIYGVVVRSGRSAPANRNDPRSR